MKKLIPLLILTLAGCNAREPSEEVSQNISMQDDLLANLQTPSPAEDLARVQALVDRAMPAALPNAAKAQYRNIRAGVGGSACGEVTTPAANGRPGPYRPFVVTPDAVAVIGEGPAIRFNDPTDFVADAWIRWCASPEELQQVGPQIDEGPPLVANAEPNLDLPALPPDETVPLPPARPAGPRRTASAEAAPPPPPPQIDSFSRSVSRPQ